MQTRLKLLVLIPFLAFFAAQPEAADAAVEFKLKGVLISPKTRSALINGQIAREGERIAGVEILAIEEGSVRVLSGAEEYTLPVGARAWVEPSSRSVARVARLPDTSVRRVQSGDTLSRIAEDYAGNGASLSQVMIAIFETNQEAFDGNINRLRAGAELRIPETRTIMGHAADSATATVLRQTKEWLGRAIQPSHEPSTVMPAPIVLETPADAIEYGPVRYGETLSEIAIRITGNGVSMNRMMTALFDANPHAFGDSIDLLREGAVLRVPGIDEIDQVGTLAASHFQPRRLR